MTIEFAPARREAVPLLVGLVGPSGGGKTYSAMRIASGIVGAGNRFAVIDTEARRALHYTTMFAFDYHELQPPFRPERYAAAILAASKAGYRAIVVDSLTHEWAGDGGVLDWQDAELTRMAGDNYERRERCKLASWVAPKMAHKKFCQQLVQCRSHLICCFRAEERVAMVKGDDGKTKIVPLGWQPVCAKDMPYELTVSFLLQPDRPGVGVPIKLQEQHKPMFPEGALLDEKCGERISEWAKGEAGSRFDEAAAIRELKVRLLEKMKADKFQREDQSAFGLFVLGAGPPSIDMLQDFLDNFDTHKKRFVEARKGGAK